VDLLNLASLGLAVPVIILFTKADLLDAQTMGRLVETGMSIEDAASKAGEESIIKFHKDFGHVLYAKKYPPKKHIYLWSKEFYCLQRQETDDML
jgi:hypothetical protein